MKPRILFLLLTSLMVCFGASAKKVKFAVDMTDQTVSPNGIHISGDFQTLAGFPGGNWNSGTTTLLPEANPMIFSIVVDLPAFNKYEYKFINGDQFYEAEFVPEPSRVGHDFNDNRWIFVDSLSTDTFFVGAIKFGENAPSGLKMMRFAVDLAEVNPVNAVHIAGNFSNWDYQKNQLYSFVNKLYEIILFAPEGNYEYTFSNGNSQTQAEIVPVACANGTGKRGLILASDSIFSEVCFGKCGPCVTSISKSSSTPAFVQVFPNPAIGQKVKVVTTDECRFELYDATGRKIKLQNPTTEGEIQLPTQGIYFLNATRIRDQKTTSFKIIGQ
jgi:hypothetical protein